MKWTNMLMIVAGFAILLVAFLSFQMFGRNTHLQEGVLEKRFSENVKNFEEVRNIFNQSPWLSQVTQASYSKRVDSNLGPEAKEAISLEENEERMASCKLLLTKIGVKFVRRSVDNEGEKLLFGVEAIDLGTKNYEDIYEEKGYAYLIKEPIRLVTSLDQAEVTLGTAYKTIGLNWYLYRKIEVRKPE